ncbi:MAG: PAS domain S-box protein, partial [Candidatus Cloacimonetes bacterium]|nr:PAS domain S-box protein [Candidatus Cloacimonadota bacterium]
LNKPVQNCPYLTMKETKARASTELEMDGKWYQISVDPILDEEKEIIGAVHIIRDISQKIATEQALAYSELKFRNVFENSIAGKSLTSMDGTVNPNTALCNMLGYSQGEMKHKWQDFTHPDDVELTQKIIDSILAGEKEGARFIKRYQHKDGSVVWADVSTVLQRDYDGKPLYFMNTILDITSQKLAEEEIVKMNRVYAVISEINQMMVRTRDARVILQEACRISIDFGKFKMAWIGEVDLQEEIVKPLLWAGDENGYFSVIPNISTKDVPEGRGPCGMAVQTMKYFYCNDIANDPCMEPWRDSALKNGYRSVISMPIVLHNRVELVFTMYSEELNFFNEMEIRLLEEVTGDISYALEMNELEQAKRQSEDDLKKSEYRFHELFEHLSNGVSVYQSTEDNSDFYICDINPAGQRITNSHKEYIIGLKASEVFPDLRNKGLLDVFREVYNTGITKQCDTFNYQENKLEYWLNNKVLKLESGEIVAIYEDATQRMSAEHELRETNQYLQNLLDYANAPIIVWNANYLIERFNRAFEHLTQYSAEEILGKHLSLFFPPESRDSNMSLIRLASKVSSWESVELPIQRKDMQIRIVLWNSAIVYEEDGKTLLSTIAQGQDITERIEAERMVAESEERLRVIVDNAPFGAHAFVLMPDNRLILTGANLSADKILGIDNQALLGKELLEAFPGNAGTEIPQIYRRVALGGENYQAEQIVYEAEGISGAFEIHAVNTGKNRVTVFFREITEKKKADDAIKKLNEELEQRVIARTADLQIANKELEAFSYSVSHDLRSPLRGIDGWSQALFDDYESVLDGQAKIYLERIRAEAVRMSQLIEGLLKLAHIGKVDITTVQVNLSSLAKNIINRLQEESGDRIVDVHIQNDLSAMGDNNLLEIVLTNLLNNAWKFTTKTEQAKIEFGKGIANSPDNAGHKTVFYVKDNGAGFDMAYASKLFGVFQRMHKAAEFPGTGVGLATVQRIINRHGGEIWVEAHPNKGATFYFTLKEGS